MKNLEDFSERIFESKTEERASGIFDQIINRYQKIPEPRRNLMMYYSLSSLLGLTSLNIILRLIEKIRGKKPKEHESAKKVIISMGFKDPEFLKISNKGTRLIMNHEKLVLKGYDIGDGKITIGYGHAEDATKSKYKVGQKNNFRESTGTPQKRPQKSRGWG
jgi:hypothetical protein